MAVATIPTARSVYRAPYRPPIRKRRYRVRRTLATVGRILAAFVPVFVLGSFFTFLLGAVSGLNPATVQLGEGATPEAVAALKHQWGLDRGFFTQYISWFSKLLHGNLGTSWANGFPVSSLLRDKAIISLSAAGLALLIGVVAGFGLGALATRYQST